MRLKTGATIWLCAAILLACAGASTSKKQLHPDHATAIKELQKGNNWYQRGCYQRSLEHFFRAHELLAASDRFSEVAMVMNNIGNVYRAIGDLNNAVLFFDEALSFYMDMGDTYGTLQSLSNKAAAIIEANRLADAEILIERAEALSINKKMHFVPMLRNKGVLFLKREEYQSAENLLNMAHKNTNPENHAEFASSNFALGSLMTKTGRADDAIGFFEAALAADRAAPYHKGIADDLTAIGAIYRNQGKNEQAVIFLKRAIKIYALIQNKQKVTETKTLLAEVSEKTGTNSKITEYFVNRWLEGEILARPCK